MPNITVFSARKILTMDPNKPEATHVAVRDGRILAVGSLEDVSVWGEYDLDERYADHVIMPGLVEAHAHVMAGAVTPMTYLGHYARTGPDGEHLPAISTLDEIIDTLKTAAEQKPGPIVGWGLDPKILPSGMLTRLDLDQVSTERPVLVFHSSFHVMSANSVALREAGYKPHSNVEGVMTGPDGELTGELQEFDGVVLRFSRIGDRGIFSH